MKWLQYLTWFMSALGFVITGALIRSESPYQVVVATSVASMSIGWVAIAITYRRPG